MATADRRWKLVVVGVVVLISGATAGAIFGEKSRPESEEALVMRASRIVATLLEWLPEEADATDIVYDGIDGMLEVLDPHSNFLDPRSFHRMRSRQEGSFFGVGIIISRRNGKVTVIAPMKGTPAAHKGLRAGDVIAAIGDVSTDDINLDEVVDLVRGPEGTAVNLTISRPGLKEPLEVEITRARIPTNSVRFAFMIRPEIGYVRATEFSNTTVREVKEAIAELSEEGMKTLVFDLRNNPGGPLDAAVGVSDTFLNAGELIVSTRGRTPDSVSTFRAPGTGERFEGPLIILVNTGSASASEIVAGAVQDHDRGLVFGETTWGKGLVQTVFTVRDTGLALTTARYFTPSGRSIQRDYESFIDYITHRNGNDTEDLNREVFATAAGRTVRGGGGITPDVTIEGGELAEGVVRLYGSSAFFRYAVELLKDIPPADHESFAGNFRVDDRHIEEFLAWVAEDAALTAEEITAMREDAEAMGDVARALRIEVLNATLGLEAGYRVALEADEQLQSALAHLDEAADLWEAWKDNHSDGS